jgi:hypothetical protein
VIDFIRPGFLERKKLTWLCFGGYGVGIIIDVDWQSIRRYTLWKITSSDMDDDVVLFSATVSSWVSLKTGEACGSIRLGGDLSTMSERLAMACSLISFGRQTIA